MLPTLRRLPAVVGAGASHGKALQLHTRGFYGGQPGLRLRVGACMVPHPEKKAKGGEDAFFVLQGFAGRPQVLGIADGVGGWADSGVDPADYSRGLMKNCHEAALADETLSDPVEILKSGHEGMDEVRGSSTACVISLSDCHARTANLGDSGFLVYREGHVIYRSQEQTHYFNCPFQLGTNSQDRPQDADTARIELQKGDVLLMGTDGLFDNVFDQQLLSLLKHGIQSAGPGGALDADPQKIADNLADTAFHISQSTTGTTPFSHSCVIQGYDQHGGKPDDITVVVAIMG